MIAGTLNRVEEKDRVTRQLIGLQFTIKYSGLARFYPATTVFLQYTGCF